MEMKNGGEIHVAANQWTEIGTQYFYHSTDGRVSDIRTNVRLKVSLDTLQVSFECLDNPYLAENTYTQHNTDLWRQEVFELFIAPGSETPARYLELEINPNNALFTAWVDNISGLRPENLLMVPYESAGIQHHVTRGKDSWSGDLFIPLSLIGEAASNQYRLNFYRIVLKQPQNNRGWECTPDNCDFLCLSPTFSGTEPAFHRPESFCLMTVTGD